MICQCLRCSPDITGRSHILLVYLRKSMRCSTVELVSVVRARRRRADWVYRIDPTGRAMRFVAKIAASISLDKIRHLNTASITQPMLIGVNFLRAVNFRKIFLTCSAATVFALPNPRGYCNCNDDPNDAKDNHNLNQCKATVAGTSSSTYGSGHSLY